MDTTPRRWLKPSLLAGAFLILAGSQLAIELSNRQRERHYQTYVQPLYEISDAIDRTAYWEATMNQKHYLETHREWLEKQQIDTTMLLCNALLVSASSHKNTGQPDDALYYAIRARQELHRTIRRAQSSFP